MARVLLSASVSLLLSLPSIGSCTHGDEPAGVATAKPARSAKRPVAVLTNATGESLRLSLEVVDTDATRRRGLMWRQSMPADHGMLFIFDRQEIQSFWMKNTLIPLDMMFIDQQHRVVGIVHDAEPRTLTSRSVDKPSLYVLEVNGGWARKHKVGPGATIRFEGIPGHEQPLAPTGETGTGTASTASRK